MTTNQETHDLQDLIDELEFAVSNWCTVATTLPIPDEKDWNAALLRLARARGQLAAALEKMQVERDELKAWKCEATRLDAQWNVQEVGQELGLDLGQDILPEILPRIRRLREDRDYWGKVWAQALHNVQLNEEKCRALERERDLAQKVNRFVAGWASCDEQFAGKHPDEVLEFFIQEAGGR